MGTVDYPGLLPAQVGLHCHTTLAPSPVQARSSPLIIPGLARRPLFSEMSASALSPRRRNWTCDRLLSLKIRAGAYNWPALTAIMPRECSYGRIQPGFRDWHLILLQARY